MDVFDEGQLAGVASFLKAGGVLAYPSESVWGVGCDAFHEKAVNQILQLKSRPSAKGLIVLTDSVDKIVPLLADLPPNDKNHLIQKITTAQAPDQSPNQATTWLLPVAHTATVPSYLMGDFDSLAVRITSHPMLARLCEFLTDDANPYGFLVSTSANPSGQNPAMDLSSAQAYFGEQVGYLDGATLGFDKPSRIIDGLTGQVLR